MNCCDKCLNPKYTEKTLALLPCLNKGCECHFDNTTNTCGHANLEERVRKLEIWQEQSKVMGTFRVSEK